MSQLAQQALAELLGDSHAVRQMALQKAKYLSAAEVAAVFEALNERVQQDDDRGAEGSAMSRTCEYCVPRRSPGVAPDGGDARSGPPRHHGDETSGSTRVSRQIALSATRTSSPGR